MEDISITIVWLGFFAAVFLGWYFYIKARNKERMSLIEKGKDASEIYQRRETKSQFPWLKVGIIFTGFSIGWLTAFIITEVLVAEKFISSNIYEPVIAGIIFVFTAISIIIAYLVDKPKTRE